MLPRVSARSYLHECNAQGQEFAAMAHVMRPGVVGRRVHRTRRKVDRICLTVGSKRLQANAHICVVLSLKEGTKVCRNRCVKLLQSRREFLLGASTDMVERLLLADSEAPVC